MIVKNGVHRTDTDEAPVNPVQHRPASMSHQFGDPPVVVALDELAGRESVACVVPGLAPVRQPRKPVQPITDGVLRPEVAATIAEQLSLRPDCHEAGETTRAGSIDVAHHARVRSCSWLAIKRAAAISLYSGPAAAIDAETLVNIPLGTAE
jgi:hypothetical protein